MGKLLECVRKCIKKRFSTTKLSAEIERTFTFEGSLVIKISYFDPFQSHPDTFCMETDAAEDLIQFYQPGDLITFRYQNSVNGPTITDVSQHVPRKGSIDPETMSLLGK